MKNINVILVLFITIIVSFTSCTKFNTNKDSFVKFDFMDESYDFNGILFVNAEINGTGAVSVDGLNSAGVQLTIEFPASTGTYSKQDNESIAIYYEESGEENFEAYCDDGTSSEITIIVTECGDYVKGTFSGVLINGDVKENITNGSFSAKIDK